jgi:uncharacterized protein
MTAAEGTWHSAWPARPPLPGDSRRTHRRAFVALVLLLIGGIRLDAQDFPPRPSGPVADYARVMDAGARQQIEVLARALWDQGGFALVVATLPSLGQAPIDQYAPELYRRWGIGKRDTDEGVLVLLSLDPRKVRIEVGYGSEGYLNDARTGRLLDEYGIPSFKAGDFSGGLVRVSAAIAELVAREKGLSLAVPPGLRPAPRQNQDLKITPIKLVLAIIALLLLLGTRFGRALLLGVILGNLARGGRGHGGGFGGNLGGGGFGGGFGGGMSGGGGASRSF